MPQENKSVDNLVHQIQDRVKGLNCLYKIEDALTNQENSIKIIFEEIVNILPSGLQYSDLCEVQIIYKGINTQTEKFSITDWSILVPIKVQELEVGKLTVSYREEVPKTEKGFFLEDEYKLINAVAGRLGYFILYADLKIIFEGLDKDKVRLSKRARGEWRIVLDMIRKTDPNLFMRILRKLLHILCWNGIEEADEILKRSSIMSSSDNDSPSRDENRPLKKVEISNYDLYIEAILSLASKYLDDDEILAKVQKWIQEDKSSWLIKTVESRDSTLAQIGDAIRKYYHIAPEKFELSLSTKKGLRVSLLRRFFTEDLEYIKIAKEYIKLTDFYRLIDKMIYTPTSQGKLGGKSSGIFLASNILKKKSEKSELLKNIKIPKTWFMASDCISSFMQYNNLEEVLEQKYKEIDELRLEYPHIVQTFKSSQFPPDLDKGLSVALDDFGETPLIVRSSSLLEDQMGASFSGKYKSLFLANQGPKIERLAALKDAIAEVYASTFGPDPIEYRAERGLLDFHEEMGVMIQEVVGNKIGKYFLPAYAGVAFSNNEFRWSPRINRDDGLVRLVPGLGTRAVDRVGDDYPILIAPGQPNLRVNSSIDEMIKYAPKKVDVINLETNDFETVEIEEIVTGNHEDYPGLEHVMSILDGEMLRDISAFELDIDKKETIVTFNGLLNKTNFINKTHEILTTLQTAMQTPVDIEFASDGKDFYLLQCRPQSFSSAEASDPIPDDIPPERIIFSANKYVSNGKVPDISHIVYVDPVKYGEVGDHKELKQIGRAVGKLNKLLPKRKFILMGPGRWGSRGDIKLGVNVTYSDINNTTMLIEIAKQKGSYVPDLSFGTHFFQDLVEASIRYLPLYPDDEGILFNDEFFKNSQNILKSLLPEYGHLSDILKVIDVEKSTDGMILKVLTNADLDRALAILSDPSTETIKKQTSITYQEGSIVDHSVWRYKIAEKIAKLIDKKKYGVKSVYLIGSTKNEVAGPGSDINLLIHVGDSKVKNSQLNCWLEGWSVSLAEMNYLKTGIKSDGILDIHYLTDEDIKNKTSYAVKIDAATDSAHKLI